MNIGDRVRLLHGREQGVITRFLEGDVVEVAIDNDFTLPVKRREVVVIASEESKAFETPALQFESRKAGTKPASVIAPQHVEPVVEKGLYFGFTSEAGELLALHLLNNSDLDVLFTFGHDQSDGFKLVSADKLAARGSIKLGHLHLKDFEQWPGLVVQCLCFKIGSAKRYDVKEYHMRARANSFFKAKRQLPILNTSGFLFALDQPKPTIDATALREQLAAGEHKHQEAIEPPPTEVDLHIESIEPKHADMDATAIMSLQLSTFETALDRAIACRFPEITFIHGAGNGTLRKELHKILSIKQQLHEISYYEDARKEKFGFGATRVQIL
jgi:hypothetical protein